MFPFLALFALAGALLESWPGMGAWSARRGRASPLVEMEKIIVPLHEPLSSTSGTDTGNGSVPRARPASLGNPILAETVPSFGGLRHAETIP